MLVLVHEEKVKQQPYSEDLDYLDLEAGHRRLSRLSFQSNDSFSGRISRISVASCSSCSSISRKQSSESSSSYSVSSSRNSRVSFHSFQEVPDQVTVDNIKKRKKSGTVINQKDRHDRPF